MSHPIRRFSPSLEGSASVGDILPFRPSLYDRKDQFIEQVAPIGMAAIYFGSFSFAPQDAALSRQALFKLSFLYRYFLQPAGLRIAVQRQTATLSGPPTGAAIRLMAEILARQIEGIEEVEQEVEVAPDTQPVALRQGEAVHEAARLLVATDQTVGNGVFVNLEEGCLVMDGEVSSAAQKSWAEQLVTAVGAKVQSRLHVIAAPLPNGAKPSEIDDESLQALVLTRLRLVRETEQLTLRVKAHRSIITLSGKVRTEALRQRVENLIRSTLGVRELRSSLALLP